MKFNEFINACREFTCHYNSDNLDVTFNDDSNCYELMLCSSSNSDCKGPCISKSNVKNEDYLIRRLDRLDISHSF